jgi:hypothetical protein
VSRTEALKLIYRAAGLEPSETAKNCFSDVIAGSWYESYVCDAASKEHGFVQGYPDGKFRPDGPVSRTEALKMIFEVMELPAPSISESDRDVIKFVDISVAAWYTKYLYAAFAEGMLPIPGQTGSHFYPDRGLTRGEMAAYLTRALDVQVRDRRAQASTSSSSSVASASSSSSSSSGRSTEKSITFPFTDSDQFYQKQPFVYRFDLTQKSKSTTVAVNAQSTGALESAITCRLYLIDSDGFSNEYYTGVSEKRACSIIATLEPGKYQLELTPSMANAYFTVSTQQTTGDGNDGFIEAQVLPLNVARTGILAAGDTHDWYTITVTTPRRGMIEVSSAQKIGCTIYTPSDVDQFGFAGPNKKRFRAVQRSFLRERCSKRSIVRSAAESHSTSSSSERKGTKKRLVAPMDTRQMPACAAQLPNTMTATNDPISASWNARMRVKALPWCWRSSTHTMRITSASQVNGGMIIFPPPSRPARARRRIAAR